jgi:hypothetical protein
MTKQVEAENPKREGCLGSARLMWLLWGVSLSILTILSVALLAVLLASVVLNVYLGWELSGLQVSVSRPGLEPVATPTPGPTSGLVAIPTSTPVVTSTTSPIEPAATQSPLEIQLATLAVIATAAAAPQTPDVSEPVVIVPTSGPAAVAISTQPAQAIPPELIATDAPDAASPGDPAVSSTGTPVAIADAGQEFVPPATSSNSYSLIPLNGERESRPAEEHGDLNLKLRDPQPIQVDELALIDIDGSGKDPDAPKLSSIFAPNFSNAYTIHNWDWACNCKGELIQEDHVVLLGIELAPGEPVFIPTKEQPIYGGNFYATVVYASEDSLTFVYDNVGNVTTGYTIHYQGLRTDPNLLALFRESKGSELPGLTLETPVGMATGELIVAVRDIGTFLDARSRRDWWD